MRSALSSVIKIDGKPVAQHPVVTGSLKVAFNKRPAMPKNVVTWDADQVLHYLKGLSPVRTLSMKYLTWKLVMLLLLLSWQRGQSIHLLDIRSMTLSPS